MDSLRGDGCGSGERDVREAGRGPTSSVAPDIVRARDAEVEPIHRSPAPHAGRNDPFP